MKSFLGVETRIGQIKNEWGAKEDVIFIYPTFKASGKDLMKKGNDFYAVANPETGIWSTNESDLYHIVDRALYAKRDSMAVLSDDGFYRDKKGRKVLVESIDNSETLQLKKFKDWLSKLAKFSHYIPLDSELTFLDDEVKPEQYRSKRLPYNIVEGDISAYDKMMSTLYDEKCRNMIEWSIGSIFAGEAMDNDHMVILFGDPGTGKSTVLDIVKLLFNGYWTVFTVKDVVSSTMQFGKAAFKDNPLVAIQDDGNLSKIESPDLNEIISHTHCEINEKGKGQYTIVPRAICFVATNEVVDLHDAKNGMNRRILDAYPTGRKLPVKEYRRVKKQIEFELGAIAYHCRELYFKLGKDYYQGYRPDKMIKRTNYLVNFMLDKIDELKAADPITRNLAYKWYEEYFKESGLQYPPKRIEFGEQLKEYYKSYTEMSWIDGHSARHVYSGIRLDKLGIEEDEEDEDISDEGWLKFNNVDSLFDVECIDMQAQYAGEDGNPQYKWANVKTTLKDINTRNLHYVNLPENHIVIDFDLKGEDGEKSFEKNLEAAQQFPKTYAELSKSGSGIHLHYIYTGDWTKLDRLYSKDIEIKVFNGGASLRRKLTKCNDIPISSIHGNLPLKKDKPMLNIKNVQNEKNLRALIFKNLRKEIHPSTASSMSFIKQILEDAYNSDLKYDVSDLEPAISSFAAGSTHQASNCIAMLKDMKFKSEDPSDKLEYSDDAPIVIFDVEVFPNLFIVCFKSYGEGKPVMKLVNPTPDDIYELTKFRLVGFNNRKYDNHILYARMMGYTNEQLYKLSSRIISGASNALFVEAYNLSYTDIYDFSSKKQGLKKFEIELGLHHLENSYPWDQPLAEEHWDEVVEYCCNDVLATEAVFNARKGDYLARQILADIAGMTVNNTTNQLTTRIIFEGNKHPQDEFVYPDLSLEFPGYEFKNGVSTYLGEILGEGGYVWAKPGMYYKVLTEDVASEHPHSIIALNLFGDRYTPRFKALVDSRIAIKHKDFEFLKTVFDGKFSKYVDPDNPDLLKTLSQALKIAINSVYGLTAAKFDNPFRDPRNVDNVVAKRGALFMCALRHKVEEMGGTPVHCKTDSIKLVDPSKEIIDFVVEFGKKYGYEFEIEDLYSRFTLVNDAVYIAKEADVKIWRDTGEWVETDWTATGKQFQEPYIFKKLFLNEDVTVDDLAQTKSVTGESSMILDFNENLPEGEHNYKFVGRVGSFIPVRDGFDGGLLYRFTNGKYYAISGTKGYRFKETEIVRNTENQIDYSYYETMANKAIETISEFGDFETFVK